jgi:hypothetical protein
VGLRIRRRAVLAIAVLVAACIGVVLWRTRDDDPASASEAGATALDTTRRAKDPITGAPRWFGQSGVGGRRIAGLVLAEDGTPVRGANVRLASALTISGLSAEPSAITDATGGFDFGAQPAAVYFVVAELPRLTGALQRLDLRDSTASPPPDQLRLVLHACDASIHGTIRDTAGGVVPGALVARGEGALTTNAGAEADDNGTYELCVPAGGAGVMVKADGYAAISDRVNVFGRTRRDFAMSPGTSVVGRVVRADDRSAIAGAIIELRPADPRNQGALLSASSDAEGRFHFDGVAPGRHEITVRAARLATTSPVGVIAEIGQPPEEVVCELAETLTVSGKVTETASGTPVAGLTVRLMSPAELRQGLHAISQPDGSFVIDHVFPGEYLAGVERYRDDKPPTKVKVEGTDVSGVVLEVERRATISGHVLHGGKPVHGARVRAGTISWTESDHDGRYTLRGLTAGTYRVYAESHRVGAFTSGPSVTVAQAEQKTGIDVELELSGSIAGIVVDQNDAPVGGVFLSFSLLRGRDFGSATTADDGSFSARSLSGGGEYVYEVRQRDGSPLSYPPTTGKRHPPIAVLDGQTHVTGMRIKIRLERFSIAGRITDAAGKPVSDATVRAVPAEAGWYRMPTATSDEAGAFTIRDLPAGTYSVQASAARGDAREEHVAVGRTDVALRLVELGGIDGTLQGFATTPDVIAYRVDDRGGRHRAVVTGSTFQLRNLAAGEYRLAATSASESSYVRVVVPPGTTKQVTLTKQQAGIIVGTVVDEKTRAPVAGLYCGSYLRGGDAGSLYENRSSYAITDANGAFRIERAFVGINGVTCNGPAANALGEAEVTAGQVTRVELATSMRTAPRRGHAGLTLEDQLGEVMVKSVEPGGPAARAGIAVGDVLLKIGDRAVDRWGSEQSLYAIEYRSIDTPTKLTLERGDHQLTVLLTVEAAR